MNKHNDLGDNKIILPKLYDSNKIQLSRNINFEKTKDVYLTRMD